MDFDESLGCRAALCVEAVYVLGDDGLDFAGSLKVGDRVVHGIGFGVAERFPGFQLLVPVFDSSVFAGKEILEVDGLPGFPDPLRASEVGDAGGGGDAASGEDQDAG